MTEKLLLFGGAIQMAGTIKSRKSDRHAKSDWMAMEQERGISVVSKGTDNHIVLLDLRSIKMTGKKADALISEVKNMLIIKIAFFIFSPFYIVSDKVISFKIERFSLL